MLIRLARPEDRSSIWSIIEPVIRAGETYTLDRDMSEDDALFYWLGPDKETFVAEENGAIVGTYYIRPNQAGGGRHISNCGYMTSGEATGRGIARRMCLHSLTYAKSAAIEECSSISSSERMNAPCGFRNRSASESLGICR